MTRETACRRGSSSSVDPIEGIMNSARGTGCHTGPSFRAAELQSVWSRDVPEWQMRARGPETPSPP
eukprot:3009412-Rhodomonas_salina.1